MTNKKIGYLGPEGTFSYDAANLFLEKTGSKAELIPFTTFHDILFAVDREEIEEGIVPVENSIEGTIGVVQDMLVKEVDLKIKNEIVIPVQQSLLAKNDIPLTEIKEVYSHTQPLEQCRNWIMKNLPNAKVRTAPSTAEAAKIVSAGEINNIAAIGSRYLGSFYNLKVLNNNVNDYPDNSTRFLIVARSDSQQTGSDKTSIVFATLADKPGGLYSILGEFASRNINLSKIESRPSKRALGDYFFFVDIDGHRKDKLIQDALKDLTVKVGFLKILGSYPKGGS